MTKFREKNPCANPSIAVWGKKEKVHCFKNLKPQEWGPKNCFKAPNCKNDVQEMKILAWLTSGSCQTDQSTVTKDKAAALQIVQTHCKKWGSRCLSANFEAQPTPNCCIHLQGFISKGAANKAASGSIPWFDGLGWRDVGMSTCSPGSRWVYGKAHT